MTWEKLVAEMDKKTPAARCGKRLDHADQKPHRHALHGDSYSRRDQDLRSRLSKIEEIGKSIEAMVLNSVTGTRSVLPSG